MHMKWDCVQQTKSYSDIKNHIKIFKAYFIDLFLNKASDMHAQN